MPTGKNQSPDMIREGTVDQNPKPEGYGEFGQDKIGQDKFGQDKKDSTYGHVEDENRTTDEADQDFDVDQEGGEQATDRQERSDTHNVGQTGKPKNDTTR